MNGIQNRGGLDMGGKVAEDDAANNCRLPIETRLESFGIFNWQ
jgi:hypothetical protein